jgi:hypothetical protein
VQLERRHPEPAKHRLLSHLPRGGASVALAGLLAGCGSASHNGPASTQEPCPPGPGAALARAAGAARAVASAPERSVDVATCRYAAGDARVRVVVDSAPQAAFRWSRAQVERWQAAAGWSHTPGQQPRNVDRVGAGAFWVATPRELVATDRRRIVTVRVVHAGGGGAPRALAISVARAALRTASF